MQNISFKGTIDFYARNLSTEDSEKVRKDFKKATKDSPNHDLSIVQLGINSNAAAGFTLKYGEDIFSNDFYFNFNELVTNPKKILDIYNYLKLKLDLQRELKSEASRINSKYYSSIRKAESKVEKYSYNV
ncbi:MAG: hypothetical protein LBK53_03185 [Heliobacteriaceae bacterium]|jgi:hypothetical protein|nr:hypothetical protein [Heliobacteriaceae bacterium]